MAVRGAIDVMHADSQIVSTALPDKLADVNVPMPDAYMNTPPATPQTPSAVSSSKQLLQKGSFLPLSSGSDTMSAPSSNTTKIACARCKLKKIKCDGVQPSCSACIRAKADCTVPDIISHQGLARGHIETLENRISELQSLIDTKNRELKHIKIRNDSISSSLADSPATSNPFTPGKRSSATSMLHSSLDETPYLTPLESLQADITLARLLVHTLHLKDHRPCISKLTHLFTSETPTLLESINTAQELPAESIGNILLASYLENEQKCFPFLCHQDIARLYKEIYSAPNQINYLNLQDYFCLYMIFAIACLSHPPGISEPQTEALRFYKAALTCRELLATTSRLTTVQNTLLLCLFSLHSTLSQDAWRLSRRALHISIESEFHLSRGSKTRSSEDEMRINQMQRRVFWSAYCLNRMTSNLIYDRPPSIPEASIDVEMPSELELNTNDAESLTVSFLPCLTTLYNLSTSAFTSFNSLGPPPGDAASQLDEHLSQFTAARHHFYEILKLWFPEKTLTGTFKDVEWLPAYIILSFVTHAMLMFHWAMTSIAAHDGLVPYRIKILALKNCVETIKFIGERREKFGHLRITYVIMLRSLIILLSMMMTKNGEKVVVLRKVEGGEIVVMVSFEEINEAIVLGVNFLKEIGESRGLKAEYLRALVLAFRYAIAESEAQALDEAGYRKGGKRELKLGYHVRSEQEYEPDKYTLEEAYQGLFDIIREMGLDKTPFGLGLQEIEKMKEGDMPPSLVFGKFGENAGREIEELARQVVWRLKVQEGQKDGSLEAFEERMGIGRRVEGGNGGFGGDIGVQEGWERNGELVGEFEEWRGAPKMDVDFSGFETNIVTYE
ncbi:hypothetical protein TWF281_006845 [Arthrobotrys megalospora]